MPEPVTAPAEVQCCVCGQLWDARDPGILYRFLDSRWWCADEQGCLEWATRRSLARTVLEALPEISSDDMARMRRALDNAWARLWTRMGWDT